MSKVLILALVDSFEDAEREMVFPERSAHVVWAPSQEPMEMPNIDIRLQFLDVALDTLRQTSRRTDGE